MQCQTRHLTANRVEGTDHNSFGGVVDHDFHAGRGLERTNVATFTSNDATFHVIILNVEHRHTVFDRGFGGHTLNGLNHDALRLFVGVDFRLIHDFVDVALRTSLRFRFQTLDKMIACFLGRDTRKFLEFGNFPLVHFAEFLFFARQQLLLVFETALLRIEFLLATIHVLVTLVDHHLALLELVLRLENALAALLNFFLELSFLVEKFLLYFEELFLFDHLCLFLGFIQLTSQHAGKHISK